MLNIASHQIRSDQISRSVVSDSLRPRGPQHTGPPCPSPTPGSCSNSCPLSQGCHPAISSSVVSFSSHLQSFPASESFPMSQFLASGGQHFYWSFSISTSPPSDCPGWFPLRWSWAGGAFCNSVEVNPQHPAPRLLSCVHKLVPGSCRYFLNTA